MGNTVSGYSISQRADDMLLAYDIIPGLRTPFSVESLSHKRLYWQILSGLPIP
jgi:hypothetical protein